MNPIYKSVHFISKLFFFTSAAINQLIDAPAAFLCVLTVLSIDLLCCDTNCAEAVVAQSKRALIETHFKHIQIENKFEVKSLPTC